MSEGADEALARKVKNNCPLSCESRIIVSSHESVASFYLCLLVCVTLCAYTVLACVSGRAGCTVTGCHDRLTKYRAGKRRLRLVLFPLLLADTGAAPPPLPHFPPHHCRSCCATQRLNTCPVLLLQDEIIEEPSTGGHPPPFTSLTVNLRNH